MRASFTESSSDSASERAVRQPLLPRQSVMQDRGATPQRAAAPTPLSELQYGMSAYSQLGRATHRSGTGLAGKRSWVHKNAQRHDSRLGDDSPEICDRLQLTFTTASGTGNVEPLQDSDLITKRRPGIRENRTLIRPRMANVEHSLQAFMNEKDSKTAPHAAAI